MRYRMSIYIFLAVILLVSAAGCSSTPSSTSSTINTTPVANANPDILGSQWIVKEGSGSSYLEGKWTRQGQSNRFDGVWTVPGAGRATAELDISLMDNQVIIERSGSSDNIEYLYTGQIDSPNHVTGAFMQQGGKYCGEWSADIIGGTGKVPAPYTMELPLQPASPWTEDEAAQRIQQIMSAMKMDDIESLNGINDIVDVGILGVPFLKQCLTSSDLLTRWVGIYGLNHLAEFQDIPELYSGLGDPELSLRAIVAGTLLRLGDEAGAPILEEAYNSEEMLLFSEPPCTIKSYAESVLQALAFLPMNELNQASKPAYRLPGLLSRPEVIPVTFKKSNPDWFPVREQQIVPVLQAWNGGLRWVIQIEFFGDGMPVDTEAHQIASYQLQKQWEDAIQRIWSKQLNWKDGTPVDVQVISVIRAASDPPRPGYYQVRVRHLAPGTTLRADAANVSDNDSDNVIGHEAGHWLLIKDEYVMVGGHSQPLPIYNGESQTSPSLMYQTGPARNGAQPTVKPRHSQMMLEMWENMKGKTGTWWANYPNTITSPIPPGPRSSYTPPPSSATSSSATQPPPASTGSSQGLKTKIVYFEGTQNIKQRYTYYMKNGEEYPHGLSQTFYTSGVIEYEDNWKDGERDGIQKHYFAEGQLEWEYTMVEGKREGLFKRYYSDGKMFQEQYWQNGMENGSDKTYYPNGTLWEVVEWKDGEKVPGTYKLYDENGNVTQSK